jgi:hypothetical protein
MMGASSFGSYLLLGRTKNGCAPIYPATMACSNLTPFEHSRHAGNVSPQNVVT